MSSTAVSVPADVSAATQPGEAARTHRNQWRSLVWESDLRALTRLVALCYADHASDLGPVFVTTRRGVERTGMSERSWKAATAELLKLGWLKVHTPGRAGRDGGRAARYWLTVPASLPAATPEPVDNDLVADRNECTPCTDNPGMSAPGAPDYLPTTNPSPPAAGFAHRRAARAARQGGEETEATTDVTAVAAAYGIPEDIARQALAGCADDPDIKAPRSALLARVPAARAHVAAAVARQANGTRQRIEDAERSGSHDCVHGYPAGLLTIATGPYVGRPRCPECRWAVLSA